MKIIIKLAFASSLTLFACGFVFADDSKGNTYKNQRGSTMNLVWGPEKDKAGTVSGTFTTAVSKCKAAIGKVVPVTGTYVGNALALSVSYPECGSVVAMSGNVNKDRSEMHLHWLFTRQGGDTLHESWDTTMTGVDQYTKQP